MMTNIEISSADKDLKDVGFLSTEAFQKSLVG
jgi:hypothetical protein